MLLLDVSSPKPPENPENDLTIDEIAARSRIPSRTIRFYQSKGVLGAPTVRGRVAYYGPTHLERLKLIAQLQDRGLRIDAIRELTARIDKGELDVGEWLGLDAEIRAPWAEDRPRTLTEAEIFEVAGPARRDGLIADLVRKEVISRDGDAFRVGSPNALRLVLKLEHAGVPVSVAVAAMKILEKHLGRASQELAEFFLDRAKRDEVFESPAAVEELRPIALDAVRLVFAREMEKVMRELAESGKTARLGKKRTR